MSFVETPYFPDRIGFGASGGPMFRTTVVALASGFEQRNRDWSVERRTYDLQHAGHTQDNLDAIVAFYLGVAKGRLNGFRLRDWSDYTDSHGDAVGYLGAGVGTGGPTYQLKKTYTSGSSTHDRTITKPRSDGFAVTRAGVTQTAGASAGNYALATSTGIVTFVADDSEAITGHTPGASHVFTTATDMSVLTVGEKVYITGVTGTAATTLNSIAHTISNKTGSGPYTWTLSTNTTGLTATGGTGYAYPQAADALLWTGVFDVPVRFDSDEFASRIVARGMYQLEPIRLIEIRV